MQFLTFHDYLLRNYTLYRLESAYEIRSDVEEALKRLQPHASRHGDGSVHIEFNGWSKMAIVLQVTYFLYMTFPVNHCFLFDSSPKSF
jgi:intron-binding protein aquarius